MPLKKTLPPKVQRSGAPRSPTEPHGATGVRGGFKRRVYGPPPSGDCGDPGWVQTDASLSPAVQRCSGLLGFSRARKRGDFESHGLSGLDCSADGAPWSTELE